MKTMKNQLGTNHRPGTIPNGMRQALMLAALVALTVSVSSSAWADEKLILVQKVELKVVGGKSTWVGVGNGPFKDRYPNGIDASGTIMMQLPGKPAPKAGLTQSRMSATDVTKREFGSIAARRAPSS